MILLDLYRKFREKKLYKQLGHIGKHSHIGFPVMISKPTQVYIEDFAGILNGAKIIVNEGRFILGKYSRIASGLTVVTDNHTPTVGLPYFFTGGLHINDRPKDVIVKEDCWIGANVTLLPGAILNRGGVIAACALVNKEFPPYAVIAGIPAKIIGVKFSIEEIIEHEKNIYPLEERLDKEYLTNIFNTYYSNVRVITHSNITNDNKHELKEKLKQYNINYSDDCWIKL